MVCRCWFPELSGVASSTVGCLLSLFHLRTRAAGRLEYRRAKRAISRSDTGLFSAGNVTGLVNCCQLRQMDCTLDSTNERTHRVAGGHPCRYRHHEVRKLSWWFANDGVASLGIMRPPISPGVINVAPTGPSHTWGLIDVALRFQVVVSCQLSVVSVTTSCKCVSVFSCQFQRPRGHGRWKNGSRLGSW